VASEKIVRVKMAFVYLEKISKNPGPEDHALVVPRGNLLCWKFIELLKLPIPNNFQ